MKGGVEERLLKVVASIAASEMKRKNGATSICPVIFHQPKRPKKYK